MTTVDTSLIWAQDRAGVIGVNGGLPWELPEDIQHFKEITSGNIVVMGTKTFRSLPAGPLKNRINIILGSTYAHHPVLVTFHQNTQCKQESLRVDSSVVLDDFLQQNHILWNKSNYVYQYDAIKDMQMQKSPGERNLSSATVFLPDLVSWDRWSKQNQVISGIKRNVFIIGGEQIYQAFMPRAKKLFITQIDLDILDTLMISDSKVEPQVAFAPKFNAKNSEAWDEWKLSYNGIRYRFGSI